MVSAQNKPFDAITVIKPCIVGNVGSWVLGTGLILGIKSQVTLNVSVTVPPALGKCITNLLERFFKVADFLVIGGLDSNTMLHTDVVGSLSMITDSEQLVK